MPESAAGLARSTWQSKPPSGGFSLVTRCAHPRQRSDPRRHRRGVVAGFAIVQLGRSLGGLPVEDAARAIDLPAALIGNPQRMPTGSVRRRPFGGDVRQALPLVTLATLWVLWAWLRVAA